MKTYYDLNENAIVTNDSYIPKERGNPGYEQFLKELENGEAELAPYVEPPLKTWELVRLQRDNLLVQSDWIGVSDAQPKPNKEAWLNYRQALRDITVTYSSPEAVVWPTKPS
jgi:hypothetical protein